MISSTVARRVGRPHPGISQEPLSALDDDFAAGDMRYGFERYRLSF